MTASSVSPTVGRENNINIILPTASEVLGGRGVAVRIIERIPAYYDVQEVEFGKVYKWCDEEVVVDCDCGTRSIFKRSDLLTSEASCCECDKNPRLASEKRRLSDCQTRIMRLPTSHGATGTPPRIPGYLFR